MARLTIAAICLSCTATAGAQLEAWTQIVHGDNDHNRFTDVTTDAAGNVYYTGEVGANSNAVDVLTTKVAPDGTVLWSDQWDHPVANNDYPSAITVDQNGNVIVSGYTYYNGAQNTLRKYDSEGVELWHEEHFWLSENTSHDVATDGLGNVFMAGSTWDFNEPGLATLVKYDANGDLQWSRSYSHPFDAGEAAQFVAVDQAGNVYIAGREVAEGWNQNWFVIKYDTNGTQLWEWHFDYNGMADVLEAMTIDASGNLYLTGRGREATTDFDVLSAKLASDGTLLWWDAFGGDSVDGADDNDWGWDIAFDSAGNAYVGGEVQSPKTSFDAVVICYDTSGAVVWATEVEDNSDHQDRISSIAIDETAGTVSFAGSTERQVGGGVDWRLLAGGVRLGDGTPIWSAVRVWPGLREMFGRGCEALPGGSTLIIGFGWLFNNDSAIIAGRYDLDCNANGVFDGTDIADGTSLDCNGNGVPDECDIASGESNDCDYDGIPDGCAIAADPGLDSDGTGILDSCEAFGDLDGSGDVSFTDLLVILSNWGPCGDPCPADLDGDGVIGFSDLLLILAHWG